MYSVNVARTRPAKRGNLTINDRIEERDLFYCWARHNFRQVKKTTPAPTHHAAPL